MCVDEFVETNEEGCSKKCDIPLVDIALSTSHIVEHCATSLNDLSNPCSNVYSEDESKINRIV
jgi:hypothetical protein